MKAVKQSASAVRHDLQGNAHPIIIFDGVCNLCEGAVNFVIARDRNAHFRFVPAQSSVGRELQAMYGVDAIGEETVILIKNGRAYTRSDAAAEIAKDLDGVWPVMAMTRYIPRPLRDTSYKTIARNRYRWFGQKPVCLVPTPDIRARFLAD